MYSKLNVNEKLRFIYREIGLGKAPFSHTVLSEKQTVINMIKEVVGDIKYIEIYAQILIEYQKQVSYLHEGIINYKSNEVKMLKRLENIDVLINT